MAGAATVFEQSIGIRPGVSPSPAKKAKGEEKPQKDDGSRGRSSSKKEKKERKERKERERARWRLTRPDKSAVADMQPENIKVPSDISLEEEHGAEAPAPVGAHVPPEELARQMAALAKYKQKQQDQIAAKAAAAYTGKLSLSPPGALPQAAAPAPTLPGPTPAAAEKRVKELKDVVQALAKQIRSVKVLEMRSRHDHREHHIVVSNLPSTSTPYKAIGSKVSDIMSHVKDISPSTRFSVVLPSKGRIGKFIFVKMDDKESVAACVKALRASGIQFQWSPQYVADGEKRESTLLQVTNRNLQVRSWEGEARSQCVENDANARNVTQTE